MLFEDGITMIPVPEFEDSSAPPSPVASPVPRAGKSSSRRDPPTPANREYGQDFASYYVIDDDGGNGKGKGKAPAVQAPKSMQRQDAMRQSQPYHNPSLPSNHHHNQSHAPKPRHSSGRALPAQMPQQFPMVPPPTVHIIENIKHNFDSTKLPTAGEMVAKLKVLSDALIKFGGAPPGKSSDPGPSAPPPAEAKGEAKGILPPSYLLVSSTDPSPDPKQSASVASTKDEAKQQQQDSENESVDDFLANFDGDDDDSDEADGGSEGHKDDEDGNSEPKATPSMSSLDQTLSPTGAPDEMLIYGIRFIMNALSTWAKQRINNTYMQQWHDYRNFVRQQHQQQNLNQKKSRGRPRKDEEQRPPIAYPPPPPSIINAELTHTPEGEAVQAFQDVLDCGILRVNSMLPTELTRALGTLYVQIDHLINNSTREELHWECLSYQAQINTQKIKVERWKEQLARMQAELSRQQELSHQQMMTQMGVPPHLQHRGPMTQEQAVKQRDMSLELKRGSQQATQQPHLTQYLNSPMELEGSNQGARPSSSGSPATAGANNAPSATHQQQSAAQNPVQLQNASSRVHDAMSKVTMYHDGKPANVAPEHIKALSMRSGQGMKFSFDHGERARQLFGDQAFPSASAPSTIPRRGPMSKAAEGADVNGVNGNRQPPVLASNAPSLNGTPKTTDAGKEQDNGIAVVPSTETRADDEKEKTKTTFTTINGGAGSSENGKDKARTTSTPDGEEIVVNGKAEVPDKGATNGKASVEPANIHKRKLSEGSATTSASPAPKRPGSSGRPTIRLRNTRASAGARTSVAPSSASPAIVVDGDGEK